MAYVYPFRNADEKLILAVWQKGIAIAGYDAAVYRQDKCKAWMKYEAHGNRDEDMGWEIDHIQPRAKGGRTEMDNLEPLNWKNNAAKGDTYPWSCGR